MSEQSDTPMVDLGLQAGREHLRKLRAKVGYDDQSGEPIHADVVERYIEALETEVVASHMAAQWVRETVSAEMRTTVRRSP